MNLLPQLMSIPRNRLCAVSGSESFTFEDLISAAIAVRSEAPKWDTPALELVIHPDPIVQLCDVLAYTGTKHIPLILPEAYRKPLPDVIPAGAALAVMEEDELIFPDMTIWLMEAGCESTFRDLSDPDQLRCALSSLLKGETIFFTANH